jgi:hypothetical protein
MKNNNGNPPIEATTPLEKLVALQVEEQRRTLKQMKRLTLIIEFMALVLLALIAFSFCNAMNLI